MDGSIKVRLMQKMAWNVGEVSSNGLTGANMKAIGIMILPMDVEGCCTMMVMFLRDFGLMTKLKDGAGMYIKMAPNMMANGKMISNMVVEKKSDPMDLRT